MPTLPDCTINNGAMLACGLTAAALSLALLLKIVARRRRRRAGNTRRPRVIWSSAETTEPWYRTLSGRSRFHFSLELGPDGYRIFVLDGPSYSAYGRDDSLHATHRLCDGGRYYICWTRPLSQLEAALVVAQLWAENTERYLRTGQRF